MSKKLIYGLFLVFFNIFGISPAFTACEDAAGPAVNWAKCDFTGIDLKNKDLSNAVRLPRYLTMLIYPVRFWKMPI